MSSHTIEDTIDNINNTIILQSNIHGFGLFANKDIQKNTILGYLDGQIINWNLHKKYNLTFEWNALDNNKLLVRPYRTKYSYINHSRNPNIKIIYDPIRIITIQNIRINEELLLDYRLENLPLEYLNNEGKKYL